jgi:hypothetical protein
VSKTPSSYWTWCPELVGHDHADPHVTETNGIVGLDDAVTHDELVRERRDEGVGFPVAGKGKRV